MLDIKINNHQNNTFKMFTLVKYITLLGYKLFKYIDIKEFYK